MANRRERRYNEKKKKSVVDQQYEKDFTEDVNNTLVMIIVVLIILLSFYVLTLFLTGYEKEKEDDTETSKIQYTDILVGQSFSRNDPEYIVVYYNESILDDKSENVDKDAKSQASDIDLAISTYESSPETVPVYKCDLGQAFNSKFIKGEENREPQDASEISLSGPTIIKFGEGHVVEYISGQDNVVSYLKSFEPNYDEE